MGLTIEAAETEKHAHLFTLMKNNFVLRQMKIHKPLDQLIPNKRHNTIKAPSLLCIGFLNKFFVDNNAMEEKNFKDKILTAIQKTTESVSLNFPLTMHVFSM